MDSAGRIYIADTGNNRIVRVHDITGSQWTILGALGAGTGSSTSHPASPWTPPDESMSPTGATIGLCAWTTSRARTGLLSAARAAAPPVPHGQRPYSRQYRRIYAVDTDNNRIVRMDDMSGTNWTVMGSGSSGTVQFINPYGVSVDPYGTIYVADSRDYRIAMADDMSGTFWTTYGASGGTPLFDSPTSIVAVPPTSPVAVPALSASSLKFGDTVAGTASATQSVTMNNIGSATLDIHSIAASGGFSQTNTCGGALTAGQNCAVAVAVAPVTAGSQTGSISFDFATAGGKSIAVAGIGTLVSVAPTALNFGNVFAGGAEARR